MGHGLDGTQSGLKLVVGSSCTPLQRCLARHALTHALPLHTMPRTHCGTCPSASPSGHGVPCHWTFCYHTFCQHGMVTFFFCVLLPSDLINYGFHLFIACLTRTSVSPEASQQKSLWTSWPCLSGLKQSPIIWREEPH